MFTQVHQDNESTSPEWWRAYPDEGLHWGHIASQALCGAPDWDHSGGFEFLLTWPSPRPEPWSLSHVYACMTQFHLQWGQYIFIVILYWEGFPFPDFFFFGRGGLDLRDWDISGGGASISICSSKWNDTQQHTNEYICTCGSIWLSIGLSTFNYQLSAFQ